MRPAHILLAVFVTLLWGLNFVAIPLGLQNLPPIFLSFLRLFIVSITATFFVKKPKAPAKKVIFYGLTMFSLQFSFLFSSIQAGLSPALAPLLLQTQVFFTAAFALIWLKEKLTYWQIAGALIAFAGIFLVGLDSQGESTPLGILLVLASALSWGLGNIVTKQIGNVDRVSLVVWGCLVAWPPVLLVSLCVEGPHAIGQALMELDWTSVGSILYLSFGSQLLAFILWNRLIYLYPLATIAPYTLLIPIFGALSSSLVFSLPIQTVEVVAFVLVILGLSVDTFGCKIRAK